MSCTCRMELSRSPNSTRKAVNSERSAWNACTRCGPPSRQRLMWCYTPVSVHGDVAALGATGADCWRRGPLSRAMRRRESAHSAAGAGRCERTRLLGGAAGAAHETHGTGRRLPGCRGRACSRRALENALKTAENDCVSRFCEEFLRGLEPKTLASLSNLRAHVRNGTTSLPPRAQCVALEQIVATANATSLYRMLRLSLRREGPVRTTAARPLTRHSKTAIRTTCSRRKCLRKTQLMGPEACGRFEGADRPAIFAASASPPGCAAGTEV